MTPRARKFGFVVYKLTFPNGKIYIGKDIGQHGHTIRYFGSWNPDRVEADFTKDELRDFTLRREIPCAAKSCSKATTRPKWAVARWN